MDPIAMADGIAAALQLPEETIAFYEALEQALKEVKEEEAEDDGR